MEVLLDYIGGIEEELSSAKKEEPEKRTYKKDPGITEELTALQHVRNFYKKVRNYHAALIETKAPLIGSKNNYRT
ncbi:hypothetical protein CNR22_01840 [Sphingobacteriaceae bacterium]|nr:hypothetical protein CNR22_01840 [Sphingobacteriaceae bacterium]